MTFSKSLLSIVIITGNIYASETTAKHSIATQTLFESFEDNTKETSIMDAYTQKEKIKDKNFQTQSSLLGTPSFISKSLPLTPDYFDDQMPSAPPSPISAMTLSPKSSLTRVSPGFSPIAREEFEEPENEQPLLAKETDKKNNVIILVVEGGGTRILAVLEFLKYFEQITNKHSTEIFHLMAGTSAGGQIVTLLNIKDPSTHKPKYWAKNLLECYIENQPEAFKIKPRSLGGLIGEKYKTTPIREYLHKLVDDTKFNELIKPTITTAYDLSPKAEKKLKVFLSINSQDSLKAIDVMLATSAAPHYFKSHEIDGNHYADGGLIMQNPEVLAITEARKLYPNATSLIVLSLGTGFFPDQINIPHSLKRQSSLSIAKILPTYFLEGQKDVLEQSISQRTDTIRIRLNPTVKGKTIHLDDTSKDSIHRLRSAVLNMIVEQDLEIKRLLSYL